MLNRKDIKKIIDFLFDDIAVALKNAGENWEDPIQRKYWCAVVNERIKQIGFWLNMEKEAKEAEDGEIEA